MKLGKVIGNVVSSIKEPGLDSIRLLVVQGLDDNLEPIGNPYVAADGILTAGPGDIVYLVSKKEAALVFSKELVPIDECIVGFVEEHFVTKRAKRRVRKKKVIPSEPKKESPPVEVIKPSKKTVSPAISNKQPRKVQTRKKKLQQDVIRQTKAHTQRRKSQ